MCRAAHRAVLVSHDVYTRGPNADVMFVYIWTPHISLGVGPLIYINRLIPPLSPPPRSLYHRTRRFPSRHSYNLETLLIRRSTFTETLLVLFTSDDVCHSTSRHV